MFLTCPLFLEFCLFWHVLFSETFVGRRMRGWLVSLVENASLEHIKRLLDINEGEHNHELL